MVKEWDYTSAFIVYAACAVALGMMTYLMYTGKNWVYFAQGVFVTIFFASAAILMAREAQAKGELRT